MLDGKFLSEETTRVNVRFVTFNANLNTFSFVKFEFNWQVGGTISWDYFVRTVKMDIYDPRWDNIQFAAEIICIIMLGINVLLELRDIFVAIRTYKMNDYFSEPGNWFDWAHFVVQMIGWINPEP